MAAVLRPTEIIVGSIGRPILGRANHDLALGSSHVGFAAADVSPSWLPGRLDLLLDDVSLDHANIVGIMNAGVSSVKIFLSHAHADAADALRLADRLRNRLQQNSRDVHIFCTSQAQDRLPYSSPSERLAQGLEVRETEVRAAAEKLRDYLRENMVTSQAYLVLVTPRSLQKSGPWVRWEMFEAQEMAKNQALRFIPCLLDVPFRALWSMLTAPSSSDWARLETGDIPAEALQPHNFQGVDVSSPEGLEELALRIEHRSGTAEPAD
jgi:hypothetical protein